MMTFIGSILILLSLLFALMAWVGLFKPSVLKDPKTGKIPKRSTAFIGGNVAAIIAFFIGLMMLPAPNTPPEMQTQNTTKNKPAIENSEQTSNETNETQQTESSNNEDFGFNFDTYRQYANTDLNAIGSKYKIAASVKVEKKDGDKNHVATITFSERFSALVSINPKTNNVKGVMILYVPHSNGKDLTDALQTSALLLAATSGKNGEKELTAPLVDLMIKNIEKFTDNKGKQPVTDKFIQNNTQYMITLSSKMPMMMAAEPIK